MKKLLTKQNFIELLFIFLLSLTPLLWFRGDSLMVGHDNTYPLDHAEFYKTRLSTWTDNSFGYDQSLIMGTISIHLHDVILPFLGVSPQASQKIVYVVWFFLIGLSAYVLAFFIDRKNTVFKLVAVSMYQFNFFILQGWWIGEKSKFSVYIALPILLTVFLAVYNKRLSIIKGIVLNSLVLFVFNGGGIFGLPLFGGVLIVLLSFASVYSIYALKVEKDAMAFFRLILVSIGTAVGFLVVNAYFLIPALYRIRSAFASGVSSSGGISGVLDWTREISANTSILNLMRLQGIPEWYDNPNHPYASAYLTNPLLTALSFLWPLLVVLSISLYVKKRSVIITFLTFTYLVSILFAGGTHPPFGSIYELFLRLVPGFTIFRSPYFKFAPALFLTTSFLVAFLFKKLRGKTSYVVGGLFCLVYIGYHFPYFTGNFFEWRSGYSTRLSIPSYVYSFQDWVKNEKKDQDKILLVPPNNERWTYETYDWGYLSLTPLNELFGGYPLVSNSIRLKPNELPLVQALYHSLEEKNTDTFLRIARRLEIGYILFRNDVSQDAQFGVPYFFETYRQAVEENTSLVLYKKFEKWTVYKIENPDPLFYTTPTVNYIDGPSNLSTVMAYFTIPGVIDYPFTFGNSVIPAPLRQQHVMLPSCVTCQSLFSSLIIVEPRMMLPHAIFYPLILAKEQRQIRNAITPKDRITTYLGLTLKRLGELYHMFKVDDIDIYPVLDLFQKEIDGIAENFNALSSDIEKYNAATDSYDYLVYELNYFEGLYGDVLRNDSDIAKLTETVAKVHGLLDILRPYSMAGRPDDTRIFTMYVPQAGNYELYSNKNHISSVSNLLVDGKPVHLLQSAGFSQEWISLGTFTLSHGNHVLKSTQLNTTNALAMFIPSPKKEFENSRCYEAPVIGAAPNKIYKLRVSTIRQVADDALYGFNVFIKKTNPEQVESETVIKPFKRISLVSEEKIQTLGSFNAITITVCGKDLKQSELQSTYLLEVFEIIEQPYLFIQQKDQPFVISAQHVTRRSPTQYEMDITVDKPAILVFNEAYDPAWKLSSFNDKHFMVNNMANGWVLDKSGTFHVSLSYFPQKLFSIGLVISTISVATAVLYLFLARKRNE